MTKLVAQLFLLILAQWVSGAAIAGESMAGIEDRWLMLVATRCTDPAREAQFNAWYDDIDIPDVLEVPGYERARRGRRLEVPQSGATGAPDDDGPYVALYDIGSSNIDKTIIEMLMATRKMEMRGRSTDLLKVVERVYYRQRAPTIEALTSRPSGGNEYLLVERADCCRDAAAEARFNAWYDDTHLPGVMKTKGFLRATRYELYRVLMVEPKEASKFLTVYELEAASAEVAANQMRMVIEQLRDAGRTDDSVIERGSAMYLKIKDVKRP